MTTRPNRRAGRAAPRPNPPPAAPPARLYVRGRWPAQTLALREHSAARKVVVYRLEHDPVPGRVVFRSEWSDGSGYTLYGHIDARGALHWTYVDARLGGWIGGPGLAELLEQYGAIIDFLQEAYGRRLKPPRHTAYYLVSDAPALRP